MDVANGVGVQGGCTHLFLKRGEKASGTSKFSSLILFLEIYAEDRVRKIVRGA